MDHIDYALKVLRDEVYKLKRDLVNNHLLPEQSDEIMLEIQKLNRAIMDIQKHFIK